MDFQKMKCVTDELQKDLLNVNGFDTEGEEYSNVQNMWEKELGISIDNQKQENVSLEKYSKWYSNGAEYWENDDNCPATISGVLGGYGYISPVDIQKSKKFLLELRLKFPDFKHKRAIDCGGGIGRVVKALLLPLFDSIDLLDQSPRLIAEASKFIGSQDKKLGNLICKGIQDFTPEVNTYDLIWIQWVIGHLTDVDMIDFLKRCRKGLRPGGMVCIKENTICDQAFMTDKDDSTITRSDGYFKSLFKQAGFQLVHQKQQTGFPKQLFPVQMYAIK